VYCTGTRPSTYLNLEADVFQCACFFEMDRSRIINQDGRLLVVAFASPLPPSAATKTPYA
jgi:hypothetical protein